jgi:membrane protease YdiL (CAAX protease family)
MRAIARRAQRGPTDAAAPIMRAFMRALIRRHPVATYYVLVFAISWGGCLLVLGPSGMLGSHPMSPAQLPFVFLAAIAGPGAASIVSTALVDGRAGLRDLRARLFRWRVSVGFYAFALLTAPLLVMAILAAMSVTPAIVTATDKMQVVVTGVAAALVVPFFEELGWTGFAIPHMRKRHGIVSTGVIMGLLWGVWHFPLFAASARSAPIAPPLYLCVILFSWLPPYRVLMVWLYDRTESVLLAILMHVPIVLASTMLGPTSPNIVVSYDLAFGSALWIVVAIIAVISSRQSHGLHRGFQHRLDHRS